MVSAKALAWVQQCWRLSTKACFMYKGVDIFSHSNFWEIEKYPNLEIWKIWRCWHVKCKGVDMLSKGVRRCWHVKIKGVDMLSTKVLAWKCEGVDMVSAKVVTDNLVQRWWHVQCNGVGLLSANVDMLVQRSWHIKCNFRNIQSRNFNRYFLSEILKRLRC